MPYVLERSTVVRVPPDQVFDYLCELRAHMEWGDMIEMDVLDEGPVKVGTRWRSRGRASGLNMRDQCEIVTLDRPSRFAFRSFSQSQLGSGSVILSYTMEPVAEGTRVTFRRDQFGETTGLSRLMLALPGFQAFLLPLMDRLMTARILDRGLDNLRRRLEERAA